MFLVLTKSRVFRFSPNKILIVILVIENIIVSKNSPYFEIILQKMILLVLQNNPYKMQTS